MTMFVLFHNKSNQIYNCSSCLNLFHFVTCSLYKITSNDSFSTSKQNKLDLGLGLDFGKKPVDLNLA